MSTEYSLYQLKSQKEMKKVLYNAEDWFFFHQQTLNLRQATSYDDFRGTCVYSEAVLYEKVSDIPYLLTDKNYAVPMKVLDWKKL